MNIVKNTPPRLIAGWEFFLWWVALGVLSIIAAIFWFAAGNPEEFLSVYAGMTPTLRQAALGSLVGLGTGLLQWLDIERYSRKGGWWILACALGGGAGGLYGSGGNAVIAILLFATGGLLGASIGSSPVEIIRRKTNLLGWRLMGGVFGSAAIGVVILLTLIFTRMINEDAEDIGGAYGFVSGILFFTLIVGAILEVLSGIFIVLVLRKEEKVSSMPEPSSNPVRQFGGGDH